MDLLESSMAFINYPTPTPLFPTLPPLTWSVHKKPLMASRATTASSGRDCQLACCVYPRWAFTLSYGGSNSWLREQTQNIVPDPTLSGFTELEQLSGLFLACKASYGEFYYDDPDDDSRTNQAVGVGNGVQTVFPLYYSWGSGPFTPAFYAPVTGINTLDEVYINGVAQDPATYGVDATNTMLVFTSPPANTDVITASFHFYFRCRFLDDTMEFSQFALNKWQNSSVRFESVKP
jgi:uncharacterized protein (TIGR02217 family)